MLENALREKVTPRAFSQSKPLAQMGGLVATRSIGQFSTLYGAIEDMVVGLEAVLADGTVTRIKTCHVARLARTFVISSSATRCIIYH